MSVEVNDIQVGRKRGKFFDFLAKPLRDAALHNSRKIRLPLLIIQLYVLTRSHLNFQRFIKEKFILCGHSKNTFV